MNLYCKEALLNPIVENWGEVLSQTGEVLDEDPKSIKALYRAARALNELEKFEEALDCCDRALALEPHNKPLQEERRTAERGFRRVQKNILSILLNAYEHHHLRIINEQSPPPFQPGFLPYFDPPHPGDFKKAPLLCTIRILYVERHATDKISNFPSNIPLSQLFEVLLPGPGGISSAVPRLQSSPETKLIPLRNLRYRDRFPDGRGIDHPKVWDPELEYLPTTVSVYAEVHNEKSIRIEAGETLGEVFMKTKNIKAVYQDEEKPYIEIGEGMISLYAFRQGSEAETKWQTRTYSSVTDLTDPGYEVSSESSMVRELIAGRSFCFGPLMRATNLPNSASYAARRTILMGKDRLLDSGERSEEYGTDAQDIERKYMRAMFK
ncbi:hypothetical protein FRC12_018843 [Ceratobasidium sp. 428]|nr:hypothetical protein FRC12_018843 [Ceratobasidium sp. 428]